MKPLCSRHFTLVEMIVSISLLVVITALIGAASAAFYQGYRRVNRTAEQTSSPFTSTSMVCL